MRNDIEAYKIEAYKAARAMNNKDISTMQSHKIYFNRMRAMEVHADQVMLSKLFNDVYKANRII